MVNAGGELREDLGHKYGWRFWGKWSSPELEIIGCSGMRIGDFVSATTGADGQEWVRKHLGNAIFVHFIGKYSLVFPKRMVFLVRGFANKSHAEAHVTHELAHLLDNNLGGFFPATFIGRGPADALVYYLGGNPKQAPRKAGGLFKWRWYGGINLPWQEDLWQPAALYGNNSISDYFAEVFAWSVYPDAGHRVPSRAAEWLRTNLRRWSI
ncbi:MAG: hypothetical protein M1281_06990 [Chloroflexi bacterium]|nr:hypothetical protein [Chloroflexota bacterium]